MEKDFYKLKATEMIETTVFMKEPVYLGFCLGSLKNWDVWVLVRLDQRK